MDISPKTVLWAAIQSLVSPTSDNTLHENPAGKPSPRIPAKRVLIFNQAEAHEYPEVAIPVFGTPCMEMDGEWHVLSPGRFAVITSGMKHVEGCASAKEDYTLFWLTFSRQAMFAFACRHQPNDGWNPFMYRSIASRQINVLYDLIQCGRQCVAGVQSETIRIHILSVLAELYARELKIVDGDKANRQVDKHTEVLNSLHDFIQTHYAEPFCVDDLSRMAGMSTCYLNRIFKKKYGTSLMEEIIAARMTAAKEMLQSGRYMVKQVATKCGYEDPLYFSKVFRKFHGFPPSSRQG